MINQLKNRISSAISEEIFPGCVTGVVTKQGSRTIVPFGNFTFDHDARPVHEQSIFDVASITKSVPVSSLALKLIENGILTLESRVVDYIPEYVGEYHEQVKLFHLLTHTLEFGFRLSSCKDKAPAEILQTIYGSELMSQPGSKFFYANATSILLGLIIEKATSKSLDILADSEFFRPLGMNHTGFFPGVFSREEIVPTEYDTWRGRLIQGEIHDESAYALRPEIIAGSAGLFSTVPDLLTFSEMLLNKGKFNGKEYFSPRMVREMHTNQLNGIGSCTGLGWELCQRRYMGSLVSESAFGKTGFTGCVIIIDPEAEKAMVLLSNYTYPKRKSDKGLINSVRSDIADIVFA